MTVEAPLIYQNEGNPPLLALLPRTAGRVLDCGCGAGDNARILNERGWRVTGLTIDPREQAAAAQFCDQVLIANLENGLPPELGSDFDVVLMSHVLEHLVRPQNVLADARHFLSPTGLLAVALPNTLHYRQRLKFLRGNLDYTDAGIMDRSHLRFYTYNTGRQLVLDSGFDIVAEFPDGGLPWWKSRRVVPSTIRNALDLRASRRMPNVFATQSLFLGNPAGPG